MRIGNRARRQAIRSVLLCFVLSAPVFQIRGGTAPKRVLESREGTQIGAIQPVSAESTYQLEGGWIQTIRHPGAAFVKVHFSRLDLAPGDFATVSDPAGKEIYKYSEANSWLSDPQEGFWALSVDGDTAVVKLHSRLDSYARTEAALRHEGIRIDKYSWGFSNALVDTNAGRVESVCGSSQIFDVACYENTHPTEFSRARSVARLITTRTNGTFLCTTWRVGPGNYMLTNQHCIASQTEAQNSEAWFGYQNLICNNSSLQTTTKVRGRSLVASDEVLDFALFSVDDFSAISGFGYLEIDPRLPVANEEIYIPQHSQGWPKKFGIESDVDAGNVCRINFPVIEGNAANTDTGYYCDSLGGSSGSPVLARSSHKVIALHHFGLATNYVCPRDGSNQGVLMSRIYPLIQMYIATGMPRGYLDSPAENVTVRGTITVSGWAAIVSGNTAGPVNRVDLYIDGALVGQLPSGLNRPDVQQTLAGQGITASANLGFSGFWNSGTVVDGSHLLAIRAADSAGGSSETVAEIARINIITQNSNNPTTTTTTSTTTTSITSTTTNTTTTTSSTRATTTTTSTQPVSVVALRGFLDIPANNANVSGDTELGGWVAVIVANTANIASRIDLLVDGAFVGLLTAGQSRPDVRQYYAAQGITASNNLGFTGTWNSRTVIDGTHRLTIRAADAAGNNREAVADIVTNTVNTRNGINSTTTSTTSSTTTTTLSTGTVQGVLDVPVNNTPVSGDVTIAGWAAVVSGSSARLASRIDLLVDGIIIGQMPLGVSRPDVQQYYAARGIGAPPNLGFGGSWNSRTAANGIHQLVIRAADSASAGIEAVTEIGRINISVSNVATTTTTTLTQGLTARAALDAPTNGQTVSGSISGAGWTFILNGNAGSLPARVDVLVDGTQAAQAQLQVSRPDVQQHFAAQGIAVPVNTGFTFTLNTAPLTSGAHTLGIRIADGSGRTAVVAQISIRVAGPPVGNCGLFGDDFSDGDYNGWQVFNGLWRIVNGKLEVSSITSGRLAIAEHLLPTPTFFRLTVDVETDIFNGWFFGFEPYSSSQTFNIGGTVIDGMGAGYLVDGRVGFLGWDVVNEQWVMFNSRLLESISSLGVEWAGDHLNLIANGSVISTINMNQLAPSLDTLWLMSSGSATRMRFDNVCQSPPSLVLSGNTWPYFRVGPPASKKNLTFSKSGIESIVFKEVPAEERTSISGAISP